MHRTIYPPCVSQVGRPEFAGLPLAVCHSNSAQGTAEVSAANYEARAFDIHAGMFMGDAKRRCPHLIVVPYEFERYDEITEKVCVEHIFYSCKPRLMAICCLKAFAARTWWLCFRIGAYVGMV